MQGDKIAGFTTAMMQDALCDELRNLFAGRVFNGQGFDVQQIDFVDYATFF